MGKEQGKSGTPHLQGYFELLSKKRMGNLKEKYLKHSRIHLETRRGTAQEAANYCKKEGNYWEGESIGQGKRSDIESACAILRESGSIKRVADECESVFGKYHMLTPCQVNICFHPF